MEDVPVHANTPAATGKNTGSPTRHSERQPHKQKKNNLKHVITAIAVTALLLVILATGWMLYKSSMGAHIDGNKYQAVFFTNGQVYFGKLERLNGGYFKLNDIYYLQAKSADETEDGESENPQQAANKDASDVQLIKLGSEVHGPEDEMIISKEQILFFENLKKEGNVTESIDEYKSQQQP